MGCRPIPLGDFIPKPLPRFAHTKDTCDKAIILCIPLQYTGSPYGRALFYSCQAVSEGPLPERYVLNPARSAGRVQGRCPCCPNDTSEYRHEAQEECRDDVPAARTIRLNTGTKWTETCRCLWQKQAGGTSGIARSGILPRLCKFPGLAAYPARKKRSPVTWTALIAKVSQSAAAVVFHPPLAVGRCPVTRFCRPLAYKVRGHDIHEPTSGLLL